MDDKKKRKHSNKKKKDQECSQDFQSDFKNNSNITSLHQLQHENCHVVSKETVKQKRKHKTADNVQLETDSEVLTTRKKKKISDSTVLVQTSETNMQDARNETERKKNKKKEHVVKCETDDCETEIISKKPSKKAKQEKKEIEEFQKTVPVQKKRKMELQSGDEKNKVKQKKKKKKTGEKAGAQDRVENLRQCKDKALEYLHQWKEDKEMWKFQKRLQIWLLQNLYNEDQITDDDFNIVLEYLEPMTGKAREVTVKEAEKILEDEASSVKKEERAKSVAQLLA